MTISSLAGKLGEWSCEDYVPVCGEYDYTAETGLGEGPSATHPQIFPNPASSQGRVFVSFESQSPWTLLNSLGQPLSQGLADAGTQLVWTNLAPGWYVVKTNAGSFPLIVAH